MAIKLLQAGIDRIVILEKGDSVGVAGGTTPIRELPAMFRRTSTRIRFIPKHGHVSVVVGTGASAIQFVPPSSKQAADVFQRSAMTPTFAERRVWRLPGRSVTPRASGTSPVFGT